MKNLPFKTSSEISFGVELEFQIISKVTYDLASRAVDIFDSIKECTYEGTIKPEITQSMIEINSYIHHSPQEMLDEFLKTQSFLLDQAFKLNIAFCGGGTHPFQQWAERKVFPSKRFKKISKLYRHLAKRATVFGQHIHIGCADGEESLYLTHALARYVPQLIALSASSPFYQGIDTGYCSSRICLFPPFPLCGVIPNLCTWKEFSQYFYKMRNLGIIETMKDVYWDIRPRPEFGSVEIRVCDTPLTIVKAVSIAAYARALSLYLVQERPLTITRDIYDLYNYNRFQASRFGYEGDFICPTTHEHKALYDDIIATFDVIEKYTQELNSYNIVTQLKKEVIHKKNDATLLREIFKDYKSFPEVVRKQCEIWAQNH